ncbi:MAG: hypothetical protein ACBZ72_06705 [Candidatus Bathyarchaeia archaeon]
MSLRNPKMLLAPLLAVALGLLLVGAAFSFPPAQPEAPVPVFGSAAEQSIAPQNSLPPPIPSPTSTPNVASSSPKTAEGDLQAPRSPTPSPSTAAMPTPSPVPATVEGLGGGLQWGFLAAAVVVAVVAVWVFSSKKDFNEKP